MTESAADGFGQQTNSNHTKAPFSLCSSEARLPEDVSSDLNRVLVNA